MWVSRVFGFHLELEDLGFHLELEDLGFQLELGVLLNFWNCLLDVVAISCPGCCVYLYIVARFLDSLSTVCLWIVMGRVSKLMQRSGLVSPPDKADNLGSWRSLPLPRKLLSLWKLRSQNQ